MPFSIRNLSLLCLLCLAAPPAFAQSLIFDRHQFGSTADLAVQGDASVTAGHLRLTPAETGRVGGVWHRYKRYLQGGFETTFAFQITSQGNGGGEGLAFVIQNAGVPSLGPAGAGMGYAGVFNCLAVEFDTRQNGTNDAPAPHISVQTRGTSTSAQTNSADLTASLGVVTNGLPNFADGAVHTARIRYSAGSIAVFVDGNAAPSLTVPVDLGARLTLDRGQAWFGFTAANGTGFQQHEILEWSASTLPGAVSVSITSPVTGARYLAPGATPLTANATSTNGTITRVEYWQGTRRLGQATNAPYRFSWESIFPGSWQVTAVAFDDLGQTNLSAPVEILVLPELPPIGINFLPNTGGLEEALAPEELAGLIPQRNWNNVIIFTNGAINSPNLRDALGNPTSLDLTGDFAAPGDQRGINPGLSGDHKLMRGFGSDQTGTTGFQTNSIITLSQIPFPLYDVLVYSDGNNNGADRQAQFRNGTNSVFLRDAAWASFSGIYAPASGTFDNGRNTPGANYVRFTGLSSNTFSLVVNARSSLDFTPRAAVNAIQIFPTIYDTTFPPFLTRGPYLQMGTTHSIIVRWRTNRPVNSRVRYGLSPDQLDQTADDATATAEHLVTIQGLSPDTKYYYAVGTSVTNLIEGPGLFFFTSPAGAKPTRIWAIGDAGTAGNGAPDRQQSTRNAYLTLAGDRYTDVWLMLGDNAYNSGTDGEYQNAVFNMYPSLLQTTPVWPTVGNHETSQSHNYSPNIPYYRIFELPKNGEAGGVPSGTEQYYSFNYGNIHFVCLDAMTSARSSNGVMCTWLRQDLAANTNHWLIAFWHHPPYTWGSHNSDSPDGVDFELVEMRENVVPILESYGVDLVLGGHSHIYERSYLLYGHYSYSSNLLASMILDAGSGQADGSGAYHKATAPVANVGTVYVVAGSSGQATFRTVETNYPAMFASILELGSLVVDIDGDRLDGRFLRETGDIEDHFTLIKPLAGVAAGQFVVTSARLDGGQVVLRWTAIRGRRYVVQRAGDLGKSGWSTVSEPMIAEEESLQWSGPPGPPEPGGTSAAFYRVVCLGN
jgi:hypothetical protein